MLRTTVIFTAAALACTLSPAVAQQQSESATAEFLGRSGTEAGRATLSSGRDGVLFEIEITGMPVRKWVAVHIHEHGACDPTTGHESAGGHFNPGSKEHGFLAANGPHAGDMPNQYVGDDGVLRAQIFNGAVQLDDKDLGVRGRALVVHAGFDDYRTGPSGGAGDRLACAVIK
ncbi:superoxide dismutase family protein [Sinorhizobium sp. BG8]|uniref:superoxide dismutase family protein n=1 Tax=Sinorhizobium sp. BG8 TaxID=2613773 RepID=UPI00193DE448|nr:superoxide dismutase family protein [Sinorhizobium sp. BG8]QRM54836.1 superoxide dismutase family protein [Sinorhizobium sp. BG8]